MQVKDIQDREELMLVSDSQDIRAIIEYVFKTERVEDIISEVGCIFAEVKDGDYGELLFSHYSTPWLEAPLYNLDKYFK